MRRIILLVSLVISALSLNVAGVLVLPPHAREALEARAQAYQESLQTFMTSPSSKTSFQLALNDIDPAYKNESNPTEQARFELRYCLIFLGPCPFVVDAIGDGQTTQSPWQEALKGAFPNPWVNSVTVTFLDSGVGGRTVDDFVRHSSRSLFQTIAPDVAVRTVHGDTWCLTEDCLGESTSIVTVPYLTPKPALQKQIFDFIAQNPDVLFLVDTGTQGVPLVQHLGQYREVWDSLVRALPNLVMVGSATKTNVLSQDMEFRALYPWFTNVPGTLEEAPEALRESPGALSQIRALQEATIFTWGAGILIQIESPADTSYGWAHGPYFALATATGIAARLKSAYNLTTPELRTYLLRATRKDFQISKSELSLVIPAPGEAWESIPFDAARYGCGILDQESLMEMTQQLRV